MLTVIIGVVALAGGFAGGFLYRKKVSEKEISSAEEEGRRIVNEAIRNAESKKKEALLEAKEEILKSRTDYEKEEKSRRADLQRQENRLQQKEENLDRKLETIEKKEESLAQKHAAMEKEQGKSIEEVRDFTEALKLKVCHQFTVDDLMFLKRGGRISGGTALIGTILKIKPVMHVDNLGRLIPKGKVIGRKASIKALHTKYVEKAYDKEKQIVYISHGDCYDDAKLLADMIKESGCKSVEINYVDQVIGAHSGPGTLALFFLGNDREA